MVSFGYCVCVLCLAGLCISRGSCCCCCRYYCFVGEQSSKEGARSSNNLGSISLVYLFLLASGRRRPRPSRQRRWRPKPEIFGESESVQRACICAAYRRFAPATSKVGRSLRSFVCFTRADVAVFVRPSLPVYSGDATRGKRRRRRWRLRRTSDASSSFEVRSTAVVATTSKHGQRISLMLHFAKTLGPSRNSHLSHSDSLQMEVNKHLKEDI